MIMIMIIIIIFSFRQAHMPKLIHSHRQREEWERNYFKTCWLSRIILVALCNRADNYIFALWLLLSLTLAP